jgi:hypothetical protein
VAWRALERLTAFTPELVDGIESNSLIDIDDTIDEVYGVQKQGAEHGYTHIRGLNAADSAYFLSELVKKVTGAGARFSITARKNASVTRAIAQISEDAWTRIEYTQGHPGPRHRRTGLGRRGCPDPVHRVRFHQEPGHRTFDRATDPGSATRTSSPAKTPCSRYGATTPCSRTTRRRWSKPK